MTLAYVLTIIFITLFLGFVLGYAEAQVGAFKRVLGDFINWIKGALK